MTTIPALDSDLLRAFVYVAEERSFTRAAGRVGRTQSAVSMQMRRLEETLGRTLFHRGRGEAVNLTPHGQYLLTRAREMLSINDQVWTAFRAPEVSGEVRLGAPDDYALQFLPDVLRDFAEAHPAVQIAVRCAPSEELAGLLEAGRLDLTLLSDGYERPSARTALLWRGNLAWATSELHDAHRHDPLPLALADERCTWRRAALQALDAAGRRYRIAYSAATQTGTLVPVIAGLAVSIVASTVMPPGVRLLRPGEFDLPALPEFSILLMRPASGTTRTTEALAGHIADRFRAETARLAPGRAA